MDHYFSLLRHGGTLVQVGSPDDGKFQLGTGPFIHGRKNFTGSTIGSVSEIREMFELAAAKNVQPWIQERPMSDANEAIVDMGEGKARYRYVLVV
jgi:alcohol dehydrogenase (NADP+)